MTDVAIVGNMGSGAPRQPGAQLIRPKWLRPAALAVVLAMHASVVLFFLRQPIPVPESLDGVSVDLEQGDADVTQEEIDQVESKPVDEAQEPLAAPAPLVVAPEAPALPMQRKDSEKKKPVVKPQEDREARHTQQQRATTRGAEARGSGSGAHSASARAAFLRAIKTQLMIHRPRDLPAGTTMVSFRVSAAGAVSVTGASGPGASEARRAVASIRPGRDPTGQGFFGSQAFHAQ